MSLHFSLSISVSNQRRQSNFPRVQGVTTSSPTARHNFSPARLQTTVVLRRFISRVGIKRGLLRLARRRSEENCLRGALRKSQTRISIAISRDLKIITAGSMNDRADDVSISPTGWSIDGLRRILATNWSRILSDTIGTSVRSDGALRINKGPPNDPACASNGLSPLIQRPRHRLHYRPFVSLLSVQIDVRKERKNRRKRVGK
jgi:hypothetical protein